MKLFFFLFAWFGFVFRTVVQGESHGLSCPSSGAVRRSQGTRPCPCTVQIVSCAALGGLLAPRLGQVLQFARPKEAQKQLLFIRSGSELKNCHGTNAFMELGESTELRGRNRSMMRTGGVIPDCARAPPVPVPVIPLV